MTQGIGTYFYNFVSDIFTPLPDREPTPLPEQNGADLVAEYMTSTTGAWDFYRIVELVLSYVKVFPNLSEETRSYADRAGTVANLSGTALSLPACISDANSLRKSATQLFYIQDLPYSDPQRELKITQTAKRTFVDAITLINTFTQSLLHLAGAKLIQVSRYLPGIDCVFQITSGVADGIELGEEINKVKAYNQDQANTCNQRLAVELEDRKSLSYMKIIKDVASVALAAIALGMIFVEVAATTLPLVTATVLSLSTVWLTMKISSYFYDKTLAQRYSVVV